MLTLIQIKNTIKQTIQDNLPMLQILHQKGPEGLDTNAIYIELDNIIKTSGLYNYERSVTARIYLYPLNGENGSDETLEIIERLQEIFELTLNINNRPIKILETSSKIVDEVFQFEFTLNYHESRVINENQDLMQQLNYK